MNIPCYWVSHCNYFFVWDRSMAISNFWYSWSSSSSNQFIVLKVSNCFLLAHWPLTNYLPCLYNRTINLERKSNKKQLLWCNCQSSSILYIYTLRLTKYNKDERQDNFIAKNSLLTCLALPTQKVRWWNLTNLPFACYNRKRGLSLTNKQKKNWHILLHFYYKI